MKTLLIGTTHRFRVSFKEIESKVAVEMTDVTLEFYDSNFSEKIGDTITPTKESTGVYSSDVTLSESLFGCSFYYCCFEGDTQVGSVHKRVVRKFAIVPDYE